MGARVSIQKGLPSDFDPWKLMSHIISEVGVPERRKYKNREKKRKLKKCFFTVRNYACTLQLHTYLKLGMLGASLAWGLVSHSV